MRVSTHDDLRTAALHEFAASGYLGTSLARIAERAGMSKAAVLYHFDSKEALLDAAVSPAIEAFQSLLERAHASTDLTDGARSFVEEFVDFLLRFRLEVHLFINQRRSLAEVPVMARADELVRRIVRFHRERSAGFEDELRFGVALGGAAYFLANREDFASEAVIDDAELRRALILVVSSLLVPSGPDAAAAESIGAS